MLVLRDVMSGAGLTQEAAAQLFGVSQPRVSDLVRGKIHLFSLDTLVDMLTHAAIEVELSPIAPHGHTSSRAEGDWRTGASFAWTGTTAIAAFVDWRIASSTPRLTGHLELMSEGIRHGLENVSVRVCSLSEELGRKARSPAGKR